MLEDSTAEELIMPPGADGQEFYDEGYDDEDEPVVNNRIIFLPDKFYGRQAELHKLKDLYGRVCGAEQNGRASETGSKRAVGQSLSGSSPSTPSVVIIDGFSGTGKSALVRRFVKELAEDVKELKVKPFLFISGKYDELQCSDPFSAILEALSGFCSNLLDDVEDDKRDLMQIRREIKKSLGNETSALTAVIPGLADVLGDISTNTTPFSAEETCMNHRNSEHHQVTRTSDAWNRLRYLFQKLFCAICTKDRPLIMFLDDLQWADDASLDLMDSLLKDSTLQYLVFVGSMRGNEVDNRSRLSRLLEEIDANPARKVTHLELLNLSMDEVGEFVADTLELDKEECEPLAEIVYGKTRGNIFFSMQTLEELHRRNVLFFSMITFRWDWNLDGIEFEAPLSDNVVEAVASKIQSLPQKLQRALVIASYTRSSLDIQTLLLLLEADGLTMSLKELAGLLDIAVLEGLLWNTVGSNVYRFAHDRIQQAAYWMVPSGQERDQLRILVGGKLVELYSGPQGKDWMPFVAADHLNSCTGHGQDALYLTRLNLECGEKASSVAAFVPASLYLRLALKHLRKLGENHWETHYDLSLRIYRAITDIELCLGNIDSGKELGQQILSHAQSLEDKLPTFLVMATSKGTQQLHDEAMALCQDALISLDAIPKRMHLLHMLKDLRIVKRLCDKHSDFDILQLPPCQDIRMAWIMDFLTQCSLRAYYCGDLVEFMFCVVRKLRMTFKYGLTGGSAHAFATYAFFLMGPGNDAKCALRLTRLARNIQEKTDPSSRPTRALTLVVLSSYVEAWSIPREKCLATLQEAHRSGMAIGNVEMGFLSWGMCIYFAQSTGYPLEAVETSGNELVSQLCLYNVGSVLSAMKECRLAVLCLTGRQTLDWAELEPPESMDKSDVFRNLFGYLSRLELGVYFGNLKFAIRMSQLVEPFVKLDGSYIGISKDLFFSALAYLGLARETGRNKYRRKAIKLTKKMRHLCRTKGSNVLHKCLLMEAEILSFRCRSVGKLIDSYDDAISTALKIGYTNDAALGAELAGASMLALGNETRGRQYLNRSRDLWRQYGAHAKVNHLLEQYGRKLDVSGLGTAETAIEPVFASIDLSAKSTDLDLLSGTSVKTEIQMKKGYTGRTTPEENDVDKQDEISLLSDPSVNCITNAYSRSTFPSSQ
jgi:predicted ATPase